MLRPHIRRSGHFTLLDEVPTGVAASAAATSHRLRIEADGSTIRTLLDGRVIDTRTDTRLTHGAVGFRSGNLSEDATFDDLTVTDGDDKPLFTDAFSTSPDPHFPGAEIEGGRLRARGGVTSLVATAPEVALLRTDFQLAAGKQVARARLYSYGLGFGRFRLSGQPVDDRVLAPSAMALDDVSHFDTADVTALLRPGNTLGAELARATAARSRSTASAGSARDRPRPSSRSPTPTARGRP